MSVCLSVCLSVWMSVLFPCGLCKSTFVPASIHPSIHTTPPPPKPHPTDHTKKHNTRPSFLPSPSPPQKKDNPKTTPQKQAIRDLFLLGAGSAFHPFLAHPSHRRMLQVPTRGAAADLAAGFRAMVLPALASLSQEQRGDLTGLLSQERGRRQRQGGRGLMGRVSLALASAEDEAGLLRPVLVFRWVGCVTLVCVCGLCVSVCVWSVWGGGGGGRYNNKQITGGIPHRCQSVSQSIHDAPTLDYTTPLKAY